MKKSKILWSAVYSLLPVFFMALYIASNYLLNIFIKDYATIDTAAWTFIVTLLVVYGLSVIFYFKTRPCLSVFVIFGYILLSGGMFLYEYLQQNDYMQYVVSISVMMFICIPAVFIILGWEIIRFIIIKMNILTPSNEKFLRRYNTAVFDFDLTLANATDAIIECTNHAFSLLGCEAKPPEEVRRHIGKSLAEMYRGMTGDGDTERAEVFRKAFVARADEVMTDGTKLMDGALELLKTLRRRKYKIAIVTNKYRYRIEQALEKFGITDLVDLIIGFEDMTNPKPAPDGLLLAVKKLESSKKRTLYIGDSIVDAKTAQAAEIDFAGVLTGETDSSSFGQYSNKKIIENLSALL